MKKPFFFFISETPPMLFVSYLVFITNVLNKRMINKRFVILYIRDKKQEKSNRDLSRSCCLKIVPFFVHLVSNFAYFVDYMTKFLDFCLLLRKMFVPLPRFSKFA